MKRQWTKCRVLLEQPDGERRWDRAYQLILAWSIAATPEASPTYATPINSRRSIMQVSVYVRVSTQHQAQSQTIEQQLDRLRQYISQQGWTLDEADIFRDDGYSGAKLNRPGLDRLREAIRAGEVVQVLLTAPDRLARNYVHQVLLLDEFQTAGCLVEFLDRPMSQDPHDQLLLQIRGAVAEYERTLIAERMRLGRQRKFRTGQLLPWTHAPFGYRVDPEHPRDPHGVRVEETEAVWVREMYGWYAQEGRSLLGLAKHLQELQVLTPSGKTRWNQATLRNILMNPAYMGQVYAGRTRPVPARGRRSPLQSVGRKTGSHVTQPREQWLLVTTIPALISQEQFDAVQVTHRPTPASGGGTWAVGPESAVRHSPQYHVRLFVAGVGELWRMPVGMCRASAHPRISLLCLPGQSRPGSGLSRREMYGPLYSRWATR
jgi:DNA invertase Pin-like site-specific DNA recombinase